MTVPKLPPVPLPWRPLTEDEIWASDAIMGENGRRAGLLLLDLVALVRAVEEEIQVRFATPDQSARIAALENSLAERDRVIEQARVALEDMNNGWKYIRRAHGDLYGVGWDRAEGKADAALRKIEEVRK